jgi:hypothetical protein
MFLLLVTNRGSNILEDLDTLRLLSKLVPEYAGDWGQLFVGIVRILSRMSWEHTA